MTGRALRPKSYAQVVQNNDTAWPFTRTASAEIKFILNNRGEWENRDIMSDELNTAARNTIMAIPRIVVAIPTFINKHRKKARVFGR